MTKRSVTALVLVGCSVGFVAGRIATERGAFGASSPSAALASGGERLVAAAQPEGDEWGDGEMSPELLAMMEAGEPGEAHERLEPLIGEWDCAVKIWFDAATAEPMTATARVSRKWILGGRFVEEKTEETNASSEQAYESVGYFGYDNTAGEYVLVGMDNMMTAIHEERGVFNQKTKCLTSFGVHQEPGSGKSMRGRTVIDMSRPDRHLMTMYMFGPTGEEYKSFEAVYERRRN